MDREGCGFDDGLWFLENRRRMEDEAQHPLPTSQCFLIIIMTRKKRKKGGSTHVLHGLGEPRELLGREVGED
jgi:hypothetical protein